MTPVFVVTLSDIIGITLLVICVVVVVVVSLITVIKQSLCKHDGGVGETRACEAICRKCGKNLGFIGSWREKNKQGK